MEKDWGHFFSDDSFSPKGKVLFEVLCSILLVSASYCTKEGNNVYELHEFLGCFTGNLWQNCCVKIYFVCLAFCFMLAISRLMRLNLLRFTLFFIMHTKDSL